MKALALMLATPLLALAAGSSTGVYRCGPDGREYSQAPCPEGKQVQADDPRSEEQRRQAIEAARREAQLGAQLTRERHAREASRSNAGPAGIVAVRAPLPAIATSHPTHSRKKRKHARASVSDDPQLNAPIQVPDGASARRH